ncbi:MULTISPECIES: succinylglutamate desuccinylase/aspartoacylase family protein [Bacillus]|uniref:succinylglutamate desuccinylase/aspartoacylase family protein n=1 Tax=Bacillus TaxID=1386 RepID=UPI0015E13AA6|nr:MULTISPECIES: succinylglutamate desuccinylase/aspartoacylase family protein [Bacillus]
MKTIGTAQVIQGEKTRGYLQVGSDTDGSAFQIPVLVASGKEDGPTIWVQGCIHGEEYGGAASIIRFFQELDLSQVRGTFVGVPVTNPPSFKARSRISPLDGANLNRIFPGDPKGTYSQRLAHVLLTTVQENADYVIDLHSGGIGAEVPFYMICKYDESAAAKKSFWLAERMGSDVIWRSAGEAGTGGTGTAHTVKSGIPTVTVECGGGNVTEEHERLFKFSIKNAMKALDMLPGEAPVQKEYTVINKADFLFTGEGGLFVPACKVGDVLNKGDLIGSIMNLYGDITEEIHCPLDNAYIAATGHRYWPTEPGQLIAEAIPVESKK